MQIPNAFALSDILSFLSEVMNFLLGENKFCPEEIKNGDAETRSN